MKLEILTGMAVLSLAIGGCASQEPTRSLSQAREAYAEAESGPAGRYVPDRVFEARVALEKAERAHARDPGSVTEAHLGYVAHRKALIAQAAAQQQLARNSIENARNETRQVLVAQRDEAQEQVTEKQSQLVEETRARAEVEAQAREQVMQEREARVAAEAKAQKALESLREIAEVKAEETRTTITVSGEVLFKTDQSDLMPIAESRLSKVADVLAEQSEDSEIVVVGHTDSRGSDAYNRALSERRADSVRDFLVEHGVDRSRVRTVGRGESDPLATNDTPSGRAHNRRVEIVVEKPYATTTAPR